MDEQFKKDYDRFKSLSYEDFKALAKDDSLSVYQKIGFPDSYRKEKEKAIFNDIITKLGMEGEKGKVILDIGCGCSDLAHYIIDYAKQNESRLLLTDSEEMLSHLSDDSFIEKFTGYFPEQTEELVNKYSSQVDYIIIYSVFHYVFYNTCSFKFLDVAVSMLKPGGKLLLADLPNISKRKRFFSTETGVAFHRAFTNTDTVPEVQHLVLEPAQIDDGVVFSILHRYRNFGMETYLLPQNENLPMWNRREDILIQKI